MQQLDWTSRNTDFMKYIYVHFKVPIYSTYKNRAKNREKTPKIPPNPHPRGND